MWYKRAFTGLGVGSFVYLVLLLFNPATIVTPKAILFLFMISIFAGVTTLIFDLERFRFITTLIIHYLAMTGFVLILYSLLYSVPNILGFIGDLTMIYLLSYLVVLINAKTTAKQLNQLLNEAQKARHL